MMYDVLVSGMMVVDILAEVPSRVVRGRKQEVSKIMIQGGAPAGNGACFLAKSGLKTKFVGYKDNNTLSLIAIEEFKKCDVDTSLLINKDNYNPAIAIVEINSSNGERTVFYSTNNYSPLNIHDIDEEWVKQCKLLFVDGYDIHGNIALLELAKKYNKQSVLDIEAGDIKLLKQMITLGSHIIIPLECAQEISNAKKTSDCLKNLQSLTEGQLIITDGTNGSWAMTNNKIIHQPAFATQVVDTTGCGDAYHAAYAMALLDNKKLEDRIQFASAYASIIATQFGGRSYFPSTIEVKELIRKQNISCQHIQ